MRPLSTSRGREYMQQPNLLLPQNEDIKDATKLSHQPSRSFIHRSCYYRTPVAIPQPPMDPLSITASIVAVLQLTSIVIEYASSVKDSSKDRAQCANEALNLYNLLFRLRSRLEEANSNERWYAATQALAVKDGPFDQYKHALEQLLAKVAGAGGIKKIGNALLWKFSKEEVTNILSRIERLKTLVQIALEMDHLSVP